MPFLYRRKSSEPSSSTTSGPVTSTNPAASNSTGLPESSTQPSTDASVNSPPAASSTQLPPSGAVSSAKFTAILTKIVTSITTPLPVASNATEKPEASSSPSPLVSGEPSLHPEPANNAAATPPTSPSISSPFPGLNTTQGNMSPPSRTPLPVVSPTSSIASSSDISSRTRVKITPGTTFPLTTAAGTANSMTEMPSAAVGAARSPASSSKSTLVVVFAVLFGALCFVVAVYFLYRRLRRRRGSNFNVRNYRPGRGIEVHIASTTTEEKVDVIAPRVQVQEEIFLLSLHNNNSSTNLPTSTQQSQSQSYNPHQPRAIPTDHAVHTHHVHGASTDSMNSSHASAMTTPYSGMALFASPATTFTSVSASPQTRRNRLGPSWLYSPRAPPRSASHTSNKLQDARDALLRATWKGHMLSTLLEGDASQRRTR